MRRLFRRIVADKRFYRGQLPHTDGTSLRSERTGRAAFGRPVCPATEIRRQSEGRAYECVLLTGGLLSAAAAAAGGGAGGAGGAGAGTRAAAAARKAADAVRGRRGMVGHAARRGDGGPAAGTDAVPSGGAGRMPAAAVRLFGAHPRGGAAAGLCLHGQRLPGGARRHGGDRKRTGNGHAAADVGLSAGGAAARGLCRAAAAVSLSGRGAAQRRAVRGTVQRENQPAAGCGPAAGGRRGRAAAAGSGGGRARRACARGDARGL